jgi:hypothetical protein
MLSASIDATVLFVIAFEVSTTITGATTQLN